MNTLLAEIRNCTLCHANLTAGPNPVLAASPRSKILVIGQAPGRIVHETNIPWNDKSGDNLRRWMGIDKQRFYDTDYIAIIPMGFCYPGKGKSGDLPPRKECAPRWHEELLGFIKFSPRYDNFKMYILFRNRFFLQAHQPSARGPIL